MVIRLIKYHRLPCTLYQQSVRADPKRKRIMRRIFRWRRPTVLSSMAIVLGACGATTFSTASPGTTGAPPSTVHVGATTTSTTNPYGPGSGMLGPPLTTPKPLAPFVGTAPAQEGIWTPVGRQLHGVSVVYETTLTPPGSTQPAGIAWMDSNLLSARLYSGSRSPGGGPYKYTAPIQPAQASSLVAAFNGGFIMGVANGGYYTQGKAVFPLKQGAASFVIYANGSVKIGAWGTDVTMTPSVVSVRQNLVPLVVNGQPSVQASSANWQSWGATCGATSCVGPGIEHQWRSGVGTTFNGALVYVTGPGLDPLQLAQLLVRAGAVSGMEMDINPYWTVLATYDPTTPNGLAAPSNGSKLLAATTQGPQTFFESWWARDFITMSLRSPSSNRASSTGSSTAG